MAKMRFGQKADRVVKLLVGLKDHTAATALSSYGFTEADLKEGWDLLKDAVQVNLDRAPSGTGDVLDQLDAFENAWLPIMRFALERHHPKMAEDLFLNITQTSGRALVVTLTTLFERFDHFMVASGPYGADGPKARELLARRGLTEEVVAGAKQLLESVRSLPEDPMPRTPEEEQAAEEALWAWYLEWGRIARKAITRRSTLRKLGFLASSSRTEDTDDASDELDLDLQIDKTPAVATPTVSAVAAPGAAQ